MRTFVSLLCLIAFLGLTIPAQAQLRQDVRTQQAPAKLYGGEGTGFSLNQLFSPAHFQMNHSYEMSFGSFGGNASSLGMYTNTMMFQFNSKLAARVDVSFAHSPFGNLTGGQFGQEQDNGRLFLRNAEIAYRPTENMRLHLSVRQSPYGSYMGPYGYSPYGGYGYHPYYGSSMHMSFGDAERDLFWNDDLR